MQNIKRNGFSMIELVFVIVILGVLAAVAVPRFVTTRTDAQVAMFRSDIASTLKAIPARVFAENLDPTASAPTGFSNWGEWMIDTGGLDRGRWQANDNELQVIAQTDSSGNKKPCTGTYIQLQTTNGDLIFDPSKIAAPADGTGKVLCDNLKNSYPSNSNRIIPLATTGAVKF
ncbi:hypothetical protein CCY99_07660 [Helicobacter sp. 16-1353]|uniref:type II secretion system protein n=1 Tax=Helicobacter sp. 16-1353 TaxID=2004996 RepID=UPI000DCB5026|nr:prepilin-type N-terminal cleavage/methylation domain-containing protein [Helicobacter sp. 16-1353]RAX52259.1 hypothetical protein CCY99_07660 [Helicobacter sp. 16-1353]